MKNGTNRLIPSIFGRNDPSVDCSGLVSASIFVRGSPSGALLPPPNAEWGVRNADHPIGPQPLSLRPCHWPFPASHCLDLSRSRPRPSSSSRSRSVAVPGPPSMCILTAGKWLGANAALSIASVRFEDEDEGRGREIVHQIPLLRSGFPRPPASRRPASAPPA